MFRYDNVVTWIIYFLLCGCLLFIMLSLNAGSLVLHNCSITFRASPVFWRRQSVRCTCWLSSGREPTRRWVVWFTTLPSAVRHYMFIEQAILNLNAFSFLRATFLIQKREKSVYVFYIYKINHLLHINNQNRVKITTLAEIVIVRISCLWDYGAS